jgi:hypothetical protein
MKNGVMLYASLVAAVSACGTKVMIPPRIDLTQYQVVGVLEFATASEGELGSYATRRFMEVARQDQGIVRMAGLGSVGEALEAVGRPRLDPAAFKALGEQHDVRTLITGTLEVSDVRPVIQIAPGLVSSSVAADVDATLAVQMVEAGTGASLWSSSARATRRVGHVRILGGREFAFDAADPDGAYADLVEALVHQVTRDFRASWVRQ